MAKVLIDKNGFLFKFIDGDDAINKAIKEKIISVLHIENIGVDLPAFNPNKKTKTAIKVNIGQMQCLS